MKFQLSHSPRRRSTKDRASRKHENPRVEKQTRISFLLFLDGHQTDREARQLPDACFVRCCNGFKLHMTIFRFLLLDFWLLRFRSSCLIIVMMHSWVSCVKWSFWNRCKGGQVKFGPLDYRIMTNCAVLSPDRKTLSQKSWEDVPQCIKLGEEWSRVGLIDVLVMVSSCGEGSAEAF